MDRAQELATLAGIPKSKGLIQTISYSEDWMKEEYRLLELPNALVDVLKEGDTITIHGDADDDTVMCTKNQTYEVKAADTSNTLLLLPNLLTPKSQGFPKETVLTETVVNSCFSSYYELRQSRPRLERLRHILDDNAFSNQSEDENQEKYTTKELMSLIQASKVELMEGLKYLGALDIDGYWRVLDTNFQEKAFSQILALVEENSWETDSIPLEDTCQVLQQLYPRFVLEHCLNCYGVRNESDEVTYRLDQEKVCKYYAEYILRPVRGKFNYNEFMEAWAQSVPDGMTVKAEYLLGIALTDLSTHPPVVWHFPERNLPEDPSERFNLLFKTRVKWKHVELEPYIKNLLGPGQKLSSLLLKFTRSSNHENGEKIYNSKRPVS